jgi:hypothetical protein
MNDYLGKAIKKLRPTAEFSFQDNNYLTIKWDVLEGEAPSQIEIDKAIAAVKLDESNQAKAQTTARNAVLERLGITADEAALLLA